MMESSRFAHAWLEWMAASSWQLSLLAALVAVVAVVTRRLSARFRYLLWFLVLVKALLPPTLGVFWGVGHWGVDPLVQQAKQAIPALAPGLPTGTDTANRANDSTPATMEESENRGESPAVPTSRTGPAGSTGPSGSAQAVPANNTAAGTAASLGPGGVGSGGPALPTPALAFLVWSLVFVGFVVFVVWRYARLIRRLRRARRVDEGPLRIELERQALAMGRPNPPDLYLSEDVTSPFLMGVWRPRIVLPGALT